jgi:hypothetical protein
MKRFTRIAGLRWENRSWTILTDRINAWVANKEEQKKANESVWFRRDVDIPARYYNMRYALAKMKGDMKAALDYAEAKLYDNGIPLYLPDLIADSAGVNNDTAKLYTYGKILKEIELVKY